MLCLYTFNIQTLVIAYHKPHLCFLGCAGEGKGNPLCDQDWYTMDCYSVTDTSTASISHGDIAIGTCSTLTRSAFQEVVTTHDECVNPGGVGMPDKYKAVKPSLGKGGRYCMCFKTDESQTETYEVDESLLDIDLLTEYDPRAAYPNLANMRGDLTAHEYLNVELYASDFADGTFMITAPGTYTIMEDIEFNFNAPTMNDDLQYDSPNAEGAWWPTTDQSDVFSGAGANKGEYHAGFFAGITIESDNVVLDLNGHTLKMSDAFFTQQGWFTIIELASQNFLPGQVCYVFSALNIFCSKGSFVFRSFLCEMFYCEGTRFCGGHV